METILASIRRIIREDEAAAEPAGPAAADLADEDELLVLEPSMMLHPIPSEEAAMPADAAHQASSRLAAELAASLFDDPEPEAPAAAVPPAAVAPPPAVAPPAVVAPPALPVTAPHQPAGAIRPLPTLALTDAADSLLAPQTRAAAAQSIAALQNAIRPEPAPGLRVLRSGGPTLEDLVRDELRRELAAWLDAHLPAMVEQLVRQELERLVRPG